MGKSKVQRLSSHIEEHHDMWGNWLSDQVEKETLN